MSVLILKLKQFLFCPVVLVFGCFTLGPSVSWAQESGAHLLIQGLRSNKGFVAVNVFSESKKEGFPDKDKLAAKSYYIEVKEEGELGIELVGLSEGTYALAVMHDEDGDKKLKTTLFGIPREGFGFSGNPTIFFGPPDFDKAAVDIREESKLTIEMKYFL